VSLKNQGTNRHRARA